LLASRLSPTPWPSPRPLAPTLPRCPLALCLGLLHPGGGAAPRSTAIRGGCQTTAGNTRVCSLVEFEPVAPAPLSGLAALVSLLLTILGGLYASAFSSSCCSGIPAGTGLCLARMPSHLRTQPAAVHAVARRLVPRARWDTGAAPPSCESAL
jgi:hypothetical protein